jgi:hypothetical protein
VSFSYEARKELAQLTIENECCYLAELSAIIRTSGEIKLAQGKFLVVIKTEIAELYDKVNKILEKSYGLSVDLEISEDESYFYGLKYEIKIGKEHAYQILKDCGIIYLNSEHQTQFNSGIDKYLVMDECCKKAYIRGAFIGRGTSSIIISNETMEYIKANSGYHLEFVFSSDQLALDFAHLLSEFNIISKKVKRKSSYIVYLKEADAISDLLALMGANKAVLRLQNEVILRSLRNKLNRQNNCETGNITKVVNASINQINAIKVIDEVIGLEELPSTLQDVAMLRLANPEESLDSLVKLSKTPISKSGLNHRFRKLIKIAKDLNEK